MLAGLLPIERAQISGDLLGGLTLAALGIPEALGYAKIAGMPVVTGLYTMLLPMAVFAVLGSSRHLVVGADSATAAILAAALASTAAPGSPRHVQLAGLAALLAGGLLLLARLVRLSFLVNFLSRTVLVGFLTGVGVSIAARQVDEMLGVPAASGSTLHRLAAALRQLPHASTSTVLVSLAVAVTVLGLRRLARRLPGALLAVVGAIVVSQAANLAARGVAVLGAVPSGLPRLTAPVLGWHDATALLGPAMSMFVVILAQSSATARAYAARYDEELDDDADLLGLGVANVAAAVTGTFVVNGSPTKSQMVDSAGGRSQLAPLTTCAVVVVVLLLLTAPLAHLPIAALATVVFLIGIELIDVPGMRRILAVRRAEFVVALLTAAAVVLLGVEQGVVLAILASVVDHLRHSYDPHSSVLVKSASGHWTSLAPMAAARTEPGLVVYRFGSSLYFANAARLAADVTTVIEGADPVRWFCLDCAAIGDVDYTAAAVLSRLHGQLASRNIRLVLSNVIAPLRHQLDRYGISGTLDPNAFFDTAGEALAAFHR